MKSYTDLEQSKKLAEILPHNTADDTYKRVVIAGCNLGIPEEQQYVHGDIPFTFFSGVGVPCWSLAALLDYLSANFRVTIKYLDNHWELDCRVQIMYSKELVDACYEMVLKLHEQKFL